MSKDKDAIIAALQKLDVTKDAHWTADGLPLINIVRVLAGDNTLTREAITAAAPHFNRTNASSAPADIPPGEAPSPTPGTPEAPAPAPGAAPAAPAAPAEGAAPVVPAEAPGVTGAAPAPTPEQLASVISQAQLGAGVVPVVNINEKADGTGVVNVLGTALTTDVDGNKRLTVDLASGEQLPDPASDDANRLVDPALAEEALQEIDLLRAELSDKLLELSRATDEHTQARTHAEVLQDEVGNLENRIAALQPKQENAIAGYLASQKRQLQERGALRAKVAESGIDLKELNRQLAPAPIDAKRQRPGKN